jgi:hypothetical protein
MEVKGTHQQGLPPGRRLDGTYSPSGREEEKCILLLPEIEPLSLDCPSHFLFAAATEVIKA